MSSRPPEHGAPARRASRPDHPYLDWAIATNFAYLRPGDWIPLLVEYRTDNRPRAESGQRVFSRLEWLPDDLRIWAYVPPVFVEVAETVRGMAGWPMTVLLLKRDRVREVVASAEWNAAILSAELGPPVFLSDKLRAPTGDFPKPPPPTGAGLAPKGSGRRAVIGVIDQGIAFAHARFRNRRGTRVAYVWRQEFLVDFSETALGNEITADEIDFALSHANGDEDTVYRDIGGERFDRDGYKPLARRRTHGTAVLDLAAGAPADDDVCNRPIIAVDMPEQAIGDPACSTLDPHALWGLAYILSRADALRQSGEKLPVVVNLSYGPHEGPHDGTSNMERTIDALIEQTAKSDTPLRVVLAAGNFRQARVHAAATLPANGRSTLAWRLQPGSRTPTALELWWPAGADLEVTLRSPANDAVTVSSTVDEKTHAENGAVVFQASYGTPPPGTRQRVVLAIVPTEREPGGADTPIAPSGVWQVEIVNTSGAPVEVKAWIKRGDTPAGRRAKGRQSYFDEPDYRRFDACTRPVLYDDPEPACAVRRLSTLSGIATGRHTTVVGGYRRSDRVPAPYSSAGPHDNAARTERSPSLLAASDDTVVLGGVRAAGTRSGSVLRINGTSAAAPQVTRWMAEQWIANNVLPEASAATLKNPPLPGVAAADRDALTGHGLLP